MSNRTLSLSNFIARYSQAQVVSAAIALGLSAFVAPASANDLTIHLQDHPAISRQSVEYQCDAKGSEIGVPSSPFTVEYINGGGNSLVIVPIGGKGLIFSNVIAGSGARYTAQQYTWWDAGGSVTLSADSMAGKIQSSCHRTGHKTE